MKNIKYLIITLVVCIVQNGYGQQETTITNYWSHMNLINPAYVGSDNMVNFKSTLRQQWIGIPESPVSQMFSYSQPLGKQVGIGMSIINDKVDIEKSTYIAIDFSYKLRISEKSLLYFGLKAGGNFYSANGSLKYTIGESGLTSFDPFLVNINNTDPNIGIGFLLKQPKWYFSISVPRLLSTERYELEAISTSATARPHLYISTGYDIKLSSPQWAITPSVMLRSVKNSPVVLDTNVLVAYNDKMDLGLTYRNNQTYAVTFAIDFRKKFRFGYSYETSSKPMLGSQWTSNELFLSYSIPYKSKKSIDDPSINY